jgi:hypothetical protein
MWFLTLGIALMNSTLAISSLTLLNLHILYNVDDSFFSTRYK